MSISEKANDLLNKFGSVQFDFMIWNTPDNLVARDKARQEISDHIAELEAEIDQLTARWRQERQDDKWIPVSERLPDNWKPVLTIDMSESTRVPVPAFYNPETSLWSTHLPNYDLWVTHWMPLPEPPIVCGKPSGVLELEGGRDE